MELTIFKRDKATKGSNAQIRLQGGIIAVLYSSGEPAENIFIKRAEFEQLLQKIKEGRLATTVFSMKDGNKKFKAIVKDIQYHLTTYDILHIDFLKLNDQTPIKVNVPIECVGTESCAGVKLGGVLRQIIRSVKVKCLPKDLPSEFTLDVKDLGMMESKKLSAIAMSKNIRSMISLNEVAVVVGKR